jgi:protein-arginine kinase activator protein McsA
MRGVEFKVVYKCTLLKDYICVGCNVEYPAGLEFCVRDDPEYLGKYIISKGKDTCLKGLVDNEKWIKKEIDTERLTNLACPSCGGTHVSFKMLRSNKWSDDVRDYYLTVMAECPCGREYEIGKFFTHSKLEY